MTPAELLEAAAKAGREGRTEDARVLMGVYRKSVTPTLPEVERVDTSLPPFEFGPTIESRLEGEIEQRVEEAMGSRSRVDPERERERQEFQARRDVERQYQVVAQPGAGVVPVSEGGIIPFLRSSRIAVQPSGERLYRDPDTGELREPTPGEELVESFAQQQILTERQAQALAAQGEAPESGLLQTVEPGRGVVEAPLSAALRGGVGAFENVVGELIRGPLTYEVTPETAEKARALRLEAEKFRSGPEQDWKEFRRLHGEADQIMLDNPVDPTDVGYKTALLRDLFWSPSTMTLPGTRGTVRVPLPGSPSVSQSRPAYDLDPSGKRRASDVDVPSPFEDFQGFKDAETQRLARNIASGRTLGDEFRDLPDVAAFYEAVWGDPDIAFSVGTAGSMVLPIGPGTAYRAAKGAVGPVTKVAKGAVGPVTKASARVAEAAAPAARATSRAVTDLVAATAEMATKANVPVPVLRAAYNAASEATARYAQASGDVASRAYALVRPGAKSDSIVIKNVAAKVLRASDLTPEAVDRAVAGIRSNVGSWQEASEDILKALGDEVDEVAAKQIDRRLQLSVPDDFVMITEDVAVPRPIAPEIRKGAEAYVREQITSGKTLSEIRTRLPEGIQGQIPRDLGAKAFNEISPDNKRRVVEALKTAWIFANAGKVARTTADLTSMQIGLDKGIKGLQGVLDIRALQKPFTRRLLALLNFTKLDDATKSAVDLANLIRRAGRNRGRSITQGIIKEARKLERTIPEVVKQKGTLDAALDAVLKEQAGLVGVDSRTLWDEVINLMFAPAVSRETLMEGLEAGPLASLIASPPTVEGINLVAKAAQANRLLKGTGRTAPFSQDAQRYMVALLLDGAIKEGATKTVGTRELSRKINMAPYLERALDPDGGLMVQDALFDSGLAATLEAKTGITRANVVRPPIVSRIQTGVDTAYEQVIARGGAEFMELLNYAPPGVRPGLKELASQAAQYIFQHGQMGLRQALKYGYAIPNLPFLVYRGLEMPFIAATQVGVRTALAGAKRAAQGAAEAVLKRNTTGGGILTPEGVYYSPADLAKLAQREGIGYTAVESERVGLLMMDIISDLNRTLGTRGEKITNLVNPATKGFWIRTAEAMERSFRQGVFEARLAVGDTVREAAEVARRSQFDYDEVPGFLREGAMPLMFQGAATSFKLAQEMALLALKNPSAFGKYARGLEANRKRQDPLGIAGDQAALGFNFRVKGDDYYLRVPGADLMEKTVVAARHGDNLVRSIRAAREAYQKSGTVEATSEVGLISGLPFIYTMVDSQLGPVLDAFEGFQGADPYPTKGATERVSDEKMFWAHALYAINQDPTTADDGAWSDFEAFYDVQDVPPPPEREHPELPGYWAERPEGMPYVYRGRTLPSEAHPEGLGIYQAIQIGPRGKKNLAIARAIDPADLRKIFPSVIAGAVGDTAYAQPVGRDEINSVHAEQFVDETGLQEALNLFFNPAQIDYSKPVEEQIRISRELLRARTPLPTE